MRELICYVTKVWRQKEWVDNEQPMTHRDSNVVYPTPQYSTKSQLFQQANQQTNNKLILHPQAY